MEEIGENSIWSLTSTSSEPEKVTNDRVRYDQGHLVSSYFALASKIAELQFLNRNHVLLFRGQVADYRSAEGLSMLKPSLFRLEGTKIPRRAVMTGRFNALMSAESALVNRYAKESWLGLEQVERHRIVRWAILQHYDVCATPLLDVTQSLRVAATFASLDNNSSEAFVFVLAVPNISGAITASAEAGLQIVRLASACPPVALRPHLQEGYLLGEYPEVGDFRQKQNYLFKEMDFGRRLVAKFRLDLESLWKSDNFPPVPKEGLFMTSKRDPLLLVTQNMKAALAGKSS